MENEQKYLDFLLNNGADLAMVIDTKTVVTAPWTIYRCHYGCNFYGKRHCCPPQAPGWKETREMLECFTTGILFCSGSERDTDITSLAIAVARELFLDGYYKAMAFGCGPCQRCETCNPDYCNFPYQVVPAMEACGIDVFATVRTNGLTIHTVRNRGDHADYFGLVLVE